jgi:hypothetical protein
MAEILEDKAVENTLDVLMQDDGDEKEVLPLEEVVEEDVKEEDDEEVVEEKEEEKLELDEPDEKEELVVPPKRAAIVAKYPTIFKDFPFLEKAMYREQQYAEAFPTPADAKEAVERIENFSKFETDLFSGKSESLLKAIKDSDPRAFEHLVDNVLFDLMKVDERAGTHILNNIYKNTVAGMLNAGKEGNNDDLQTAAKILHEFIFPNAQYSAPTKFAKEEPKKNEADEERNKFAQRQFENTRDDLSTRVDNVLRSTISANIDPKGMMSDYVKKNAINDCVAEINNIIISDKRFRSTLDRLWQDASKDGYGRNSVDKIKSVFLSRAKPELLDVIKKIRASALKGITPRKSLNEPERKGPLPVGKTASPNSSNKKNELPRTMTTREFFDQD